MKEHNPGLAAAVKFLTATPTANVPERSISEKIDSLISMRIDLSANLAPNPAPDQPSDQLFDVWHVSLPPNAAANIKTTPAFGLKLNDKLIEIITPAAHFI